MKFDFTKEPGKELLNRKLNHAGEPLISIITPYYNAGKYFEQTFRCVMNQTFPWFEWIVVDDGSTNEYDIRILHELSKQDDRIFVYRKNNNGPASARNYAVQKVNTDIIVPLDADDLIEPIYIEYLFWSLYYNRDHAWAYTNSIGFQNLEYIWDREFNAETLKSYNYLVYSAAIRKKDFFDVEGYDQTTNHAYEDWHIWLKLLSQHKKPIRIGAYGFWYRRLDDGEFSRVNKNPEVRKLALDIVEKTAKTVDVSVQAKEYPTKKFCYINPKLITSNWNRPVFQHHHKIRVMLLLPWMEMGGADLFNLDICRLIDKERFEISILTTMPSENSWRQRFEEYVTDIFTLPDFLDTEHFPEFISYFIQSREIDVMFLSNSYYGYYLLPWIREQFPTLAIIDYVHMEEWYWRNGGYARTSGAMGNILEKTYVCNERTRQVMIRDFGRNPESVETLYIGVDQELYAADTVESGLMRAALGIAPERPVVLFPCRIHPQKRPFLMVEIAKAVCKRIPDAAFVVVGDGPQLEELERVITREGLQKTIYLAGRQQEMRAYYKDSDLTLICSLKEGLALTAYESLSMGKPVVTSDVGGQAELIDSSVGRVLPLLQSEETDLDKRDFPEQEIQQYVNAIEEILSDKNKYSSMSIACRKKIERQFSSQRMIQKLESIFENLCTNRELKQSRQKLAADLNRFDAMIRDHFTMYCMWEAKEQESEEVWISREWFRGLYEQALARKQASDLWPVPAEKNTAQQRLDEIYQMRSWKLIQKYRHFMDDTAVGKILSKIRNLLFQRKS